MFEAYRTRVRRVKCCELVRDPDSPLSFRKDDRVQTKVQREVPNATFGIPADCSGCVHHRHRTAPQTSTFYCLRTCCVISRFLEGWVLGYYLISLAMLSLRKASSQFK